ncbi:hypothetical protein SVAN01_06883 [Stagonosporopsis vannaccii]|nr:hypothetical protein SVAN01_06883 [Stagonosporopsis vannaccii]
MEPLSASVFASIGSAFKFADVAVRIAEVGSENAVFVRAICVVRSDLEEVERLLSLESVLVKLTGTPGKLPWVKAAIQNTRRALNEIGKWVERARVEQETTGSIKFETRVRWVFNDHEKLVNRKTELSTCHQQLSNVLGYLAGLEDMPAKPVTLDCEDASYFDDILSRHRRSNRQQTSKAKAEVHRSGKLLKVKHACIHLHFEPSPSTYTPPTLSVWSSPKAAETAIHKRYDSEGLPPVSSSPLPPGSPPPAYATAISLEPVIHNVRWNPSTKTTIARDVTAVRSFQREDALGNTCKSIWSYKSNSEDMNVPELAGDVVSLSATNSAGPVNPYELCSKTEQAVSSRTYAAQEPYENLAEMLGDLQFPAELPSNDSGLPPGYPPRLRAKLDQLGLARTMRTQPRSRTTSEYSPRVHRRPVPANALSDSLLTVHELPSTLTAQDTMLKASNDPSNLMTTSTFATELSSNPSANQRPASYTTYQSQWDPEAPRTSSNRHCSAPPPFVPMRGECAAAFSADSTSSWGLNTEPKQPNGHSAQESVRFTRVQNQKRLMELLGSIDT